MQSDWILTKSLWMLNVGGSALVVWRLYSAGLHRTYVSDLERGARNPSIESIEKLARALHVSVAKLFK